MPTLTASWSTALRLCPQNLCALLVRGFKGSGSLRTPCTMCCPRNPKRAMEILTVGTQAKEKRSAAWAPHQSQTATCACGCQRVCSVLCSQTSLGGMKPSSRQNAQRSHQRVNNEHLLQ